MAVKGEFLPYPSIDRSRQPAAFKAGTQNPREFGMMDFYSRTLGLRLPDRSGDLIVFMHGIHGSDHHMIAFVKSEAPGHHHYSWDVGSISDIGLGATYMLEKGYDRGWGLGRHVIGSNYFHYVRNPWGRYSEYSADIDFVPSTHDWDAGDHPQEESPKRRSGLSRIAPNARKDSHFADSFCLEPTLSSSIVSFGLLAMARRSARVDAFVQVKSSRWF